MTSPKSPAQAAAAAQSTAPQTVEAATSRRLESGSAAAEPAPLEIDHQQGEIDEQTFDEQRSAYTASLSSSVINYPVEHGRRYHAYRKGSYLYPNDDREAERLDVMHHLMVKTLGGRIYLAPVDKDKVQNILDIGTGTGSLAIDIADAIPNAQVLGCDLSPTQTLWVPPNVKFEVDDVESEWTYERKFDFIICRYMTSSINDWPRLFSRIYENVLPGGWAEFQDFDLEYISDDGTLTEEHYFRKWNKCFIEGASRVNRDVNPGHKLRSWAEKAGFVNIREQRFKVPLGTWPKDPLLKETGMMNLVQALDGLEAFSLKIFDLLGWDRVQTEILLANVRKEIKANKSHSYANFYVVHGQKLEA